jgi:subtilisin family serine protease
VSADDFHGADYQNGGFDTISWFGTAKNPLLVGAVDDIPAGYSGPSSVVMLPFSSWGPCDDGRIKPDIVTNGYAVLSTDTTDTGYFDGTGTSMAAPGATGSINLIAHEFTSRFGYRPLSSTLKAIVINTADEAGAAEGPDYSFGWGLLDTYTAIDVLEAGPADERGVLEASISTGETKDYHFTVDAPQPVRLTMVWTDPPGTPPAPALDPPNKMLVNDLDLRITSVNGGVTSLPWTLDGLNPSAAAVRADNSTDNVESIDIDLAPADQYVVHVTHKGTLSDGPQAYALVWRGLRKTTPTGVGPSATPQLSLELPSPHPVRTSATIGYQLEHSANVSIRVYDVRGRLVQTLLQNSARPAGRGSIALDANTLPSGVYFVKMISSARTVTRKITILK